MAKSELEIYQEKFKYYQEKKDLTLDRIRLIRDKIVSNTEDVLRVNTYRIEILDLEASIEGIENYYSHYNDRIQAIQVKEKTLTKECEENFKEYYDLITSISPANLKQHSMQIQEQYNKIMSVIDKEWKGTEKNALYSLMKELLKRMKKIQ